MLGSSKSASGKQLPISAHPIFPIVVAVWFAALLGIGSLVLPIAIFERIFAITGISSLVSAAQAPLGMTARLLIAVSFAALGAGGGLFIARKVAAAQRGEAGRAYLSKDREGDDELTAKKPISAHEELGSDSFDDPIEQPADRPEYTGKRRALAVTDDSGRSDFLETAPLPGSDSALDNANYSPFGPPTAEPLDIMVEAPEEPEEEPLELAALAEAEETDVSHAAVPVAFETDEPVEVPAEQEPAFPDTPAFEAPREFEAAADNTETETHVPYNPLEGTPPADMDLAPKFGAAQAPAQDQAATYVEPAVDAPEPAPFTAPAEVIEASVEEPSVTEPTDTKGVTGRPLNELGMVELVERFALALQSKSAEEAAVVDAPSDEEPAEEPAEQAAPMVFRRSKTVDASDTPLEVTQPVAEPPATEPTPAIPAAMRGIEIDVEDDAEEDDSDFAGLSLTLKNVVPSTAVAEASSDKAETADEGKDAGYSSLLNMKRPPAPAQEFVRIEESDDASSEIEPVVVFPGQDDRKAAPASDGTPREPVMAANPSAPAAPRPFDAPPAGGQDRNAAQADSGETERALREALEKLQRMSGAA